MLTLCVEMGINVFVLDPRAEMRLLKGQIGRFQNPLSF